MKCNQPATAPVDDEEEPKMFKIITKLINRSKTNLKVIPPGTYTMIVDKQKVTQLPNGTIMHTIEFTELERELHDKDQ